MARSPYIESPGAKSFRDPAGVKAGSDHVKEALDKNVRKTDGSVHLGDAEENDTVENGDGC